MTRGKAIAVVGPSGAGKDTIIAAACEKRPELIWAQRTITRPSAQGGEPYLGVSPKEFAALNAAGNFCLTWTAHGLSYGLPASMLTQIEGGKTVVFNGSRNAMDQTKAVFADLRVIQITADIDILAARLAARARETDDEIRARLARQTAGFSADLPVQIIENNTRIEDAVSAFLNAIA